MYFSQLKIAQTLFPSTHYPLFVSLDRLFSLLWSKLMTCRIFSRLKPLLLSVTSLQKILSNFCHLLDPTRGPEGGKQAHDKDDSASVVIILGSLVAALSLALLILGVCFLFWRKKHRKGNLLYCLTYYNVYYNVLLTCIITPDAADICISVVFRERFTYIFSAKRGILLLTKGVSF